MARTKKAVGDIGKTSPDIKVHINPDTKALLREEATKADQSLSEYCRNIIERHVDWMLDHRDDEYKQRLTSIKSSFDILSEQIHKDLNQARKIVEELN